MPARTHLSIGEVLSLLREEFPDITISKIRFLESQGLVDPERTPSGYRKFYDPDVERLRWILRQQRENFLPLKVIRGRLEEPSADDPDAPPAGGGPVRPPVDDAAPSLFGELSPGAGGRGGGEQQSTLPVGEGKPTPGVGGRAAVDHVAAVRVAEVSAGGRVDPDPVGAGPVGAGRVGGRHEPVATAPPPPAQAVEPAPLPHPAVEVAASAPADEAVAADPTPPVAPVVAEPAPGDSVGAMPAPPAVSSAVAAAPIEPGAPRQPRPERTATERPVTRPPVTGRPVGEPPVTEPPVAERRVTERRTTAPVTAPPVTAPPDAEPLVDERPAHEPPAPVERDARPPRAAPGRPVVATHPDADDEVDSYTLAELARAARTTESEVAALRDYGLIVPDGGAGGTAYYGPDALAVVEVAATFARHGVEARHLRSWKTGADREAALFEQVVVPLLRQRNPGARRQAADTVSELAEAGGALRELLVRRAIRELS